MYALRLNHQRGQKVHKTICNSSKKLQCGKLNPKKSAKYLSGALYSMESAVEEQ